MLTVFYADDEFDDVGKLVNDEEGDMTYWWWRVDGLLHVSQHNNGATQPTREKTPKKRENDNGGGGEHGSDREKESRRKTPTPHSPLFINCMCLKNKKVAQ